MDSWLGHITKRLQNVSKGKGNFHESCSEDLSNVKLDSPRSLASRLGRVNKLKEEKFGDCLNGKHLGIYECGVEEDSCDVECSGNNDERLSDSVGNRAFLRRNQRYKSLVKPLSMENGVMSRLCRENMSMEEYMRSPFPSPCGSFRRPLLVTDGTQVISKNTGDFSGPRVPNCGIPQLKKLESSVLYVKRRPEIEKSASRRSVNGIESNDGALLLCVGISIGIMSSFVANKMKVNKVEASSKQTESLVNDIEDELKTKDSLTMKDDLHNGEKQCDEKTAEKSESISNIEAELEAELERLEINMNSSKIETRLSDVFELEPEFEIEFAQGELKDDQVKRVDKTESNQEPSGNATPESGNYTVSPRELSLRLHKVINSRYEERIKELENALLESQRKMKQLVMESEEKKKPLLKIWESHESTKHKRDFEKKNNNNSAEIQPLVMNLSGEALNAFNESYEELMDINDYSEEDNTPLEMQGNEQQEELSLTSKSSPWSHKDYIKDSSRTSEDMSCFKLQDLLDPSDEEEEEELESEMEKQLIKQIVEKTKQGSSAVINAQKILFLMEDIEHNL